MRSVRVMEGYCDLLARPGCAVESFTLRFSPYDGVSMRSLVVNLLVWAILLAPFNALALSLRCGCSDGASPTVSANEIQDEKPCCCSPEQPAERDRGHDRQVPCQDNDCPASCCTVLALQVFVPPRETVVPGDEPDVLVGTLYDAGQRSLAHLKQLKRPPRSV